MILFTFAPIVAAAFLLLLGEIFDVSFMLPTRAHEGALFWSPKDMFPEKSDEDARWEEMIKEAVRLQLEDRPLPDRGTVTMPDYEPASSWLPNEEHRKECDDLDEVFDTFEGTF